MFVSFALTWYYVIVGRFNADHVTVHAKSVSKLSLEGPIIFIKIIKLQAVGAEAFTV